MDLEWHDVFRLPHFEVDMLSIRWLRVLFAFVFTFTIPLSKASAQEVEAVRAQKGMVSSQQWIASQVGADILASGGNAVDAAIATGFALAVTHPTAGNIGGGGFMVIHCAAEKRQWVVDFGMIAPGKLDPEDMAQGGRAGFKSGLGMKFLKFLN